VQQIFDETIKKWSEVPFTTAALPAQVGLRDCLKAAQKEDEYSFERMSFLAKGEKSEEYAKLHRHDLVRLQSMAKRYRLHPDDGVLEYTAGSGYVPYIPKRFMPLQERGYLEEVVV